MLKFISNFFITSAHACASCGFNDESSPYFLVLIVFMTLIPVICVGSVAYYLKKHSEAPAEKQSEKNRTSP